MVNKQFSYNESTRSRKIMNAATNLISLNFEIFLLGLKTLQEI